VKPLAAMRVFAFVLTSGLWGLAGCGSGGGDNPNAEQDLNQLGMMFHNYSDVHRGEGPAKADDFQEIVGDTKAKQALEGLKAGKYEFLWNVRLLDVAKTPAGTGSTLLGWEKDAPTKGGRVLMVDGSTKKMSADEFKAAPQAKGK
jgi:hypothetical protein